MASIEHTDTNAVGARAFARTYDHPSYADPWAAIEDYRRVLDFSAAHPDQGSLAVARALDLPRSRVRPWLDGSRPDCLRGLQAAESRGWIHVSPESDTFRGLNALVAWVFSGGSISSASFRPYWAVRGQDDRRLLDSAAALADADLDFSRSDTRGRALEVEPVADATVLGRVLTVLGAPRGTKNASAAIRLPDYLADTPPDIGREFVQIYLVNRGHAHDGVLRFREERPAGYLNDLARLIRRQTGEAVRVSEKNVYLSPEASAAARDWEPLLDGEKGHSGV